MTPRLFIGMPTYDGVKAPTVSSLLALTEEIRARGLGYEVQILPGISLLEYARAVLAARFLATAECTHFLMVDADMEFAPDVVTRMLAADVDLIGVSASKKSLDLDKVRAAVLAGRSDWRTAGLSITVDLGPRVETVRGAAKTLGGVGTGLLLAKRLVIQRVWDAHPELMFENYAGSNERLCLMFRSGIRDGQLLGEDVGFCRLWRELGGEIHLLLDADIGHHGNYCYRANLDHLYNPPGVATKDAPTVATGCRSAGCRTAPRCICVCKRCKTECARAIALPAPSADDMLATLERIAAMEIP